VQRQIDLDGCVNFRDLGGYPTEGGRRLRWRTLFRSDALHALSESDVTSLRDDLDLSAVVDLRSSFELDASGRGLLGTEPIDFHHTPLFDGEPHAGEQTMSAEQTTLGERYVGLLELAREPIARVIGILASTRGSAVYHCAAGKDRTGVISAVLLGVLGVPDELIVADYALSAENIDAIIERVMNMKGYEAALSKMPADTLHARPETMEFVVGEIATRYGSMSDYLRAAGVSDDVLVALAHKCLD
jgi:protein tyrosine/serine phosphatase